MIDVGGAAVGLSNNTGRVVSEDVVTGGDGDGNGTDLNSSVDAVSVLSDLNVGGNECDTLGFIVSTRGLGTGLSGGVWVVSLGHGLVGSEPFPGVVVPATVATVVGEETLGAVNEFLRGHDDLFVSGNDVSGLNRLGGREGPA